MSTALTNLDLPLLAVRINDSHRMCGSCLTAGAQHAMNAGDALIEAKSRMEHGDWIPWAEAALDFSVRTAQTYMQMARNRERIELLMTGADGIPFQDRLLGVSGDDAGDQAERDGPATSGTVAENGDEQARLRKDDEPKSATDCAFDDAPKQAPDRPPKLGIRDALKALSKPREAKPVPDESASIISPPTSRKPRKGEAEADALDAAVQQLRDAVEQYVLKVPVNQMTAAAIRLRELSRDIREISQQLKRDQVDEAREHAEDNARLIKKYGLPRNATDRDIAIAMFELPADISDEEMGSAMLESWKRQLDAMEARRSAERKSETGVTEECSEEVLV